MTVAEQSSKALVLGLIGETVREIGILTLVFGTLDEYNRTHSAAQMNTALVVIVLGGSVLAITGGITLKWLVS